jgi:hypothetical protein
MSIKDSAVIHAYLRILLGLDTDPNVPDTTKIYPVLFKILELANTNGAFTLDEVAVLSKIIDWVTENIIDKKPEPKVEEKVTSVAKGKTAVDSKITEL